MLRPGGRAVIVVPAGPGTYDYYDRFLGHERRYGRGELAGKARAAGLEVLEDAHLGALLYPAFWAVKKRNRRRYDHLRGAALEERVAAGHRHARRTRALGAWSCRAGANAAAPRDAAPVRDPRTDRRAPTAGAAAMTASGGRELLSVVVPAYNEEDNVARVYERLRR